MQLQVMSRRVCKPMTATRCMQQSSMDVQVEDVVFSTYDACTQPDKEGPFKGKPFKAQVGHSHLTLSAVACVPAMSRV